MHVGKFTKGRGLFIPEDYTPPKEMPDDEFPMLFTTGRHYAQYNFGSMTRKTAGLGKIYGEAMAEINPLDAQRLGVEEGAWIKMISRRGSVRVRATLTDRSQVGTIFIPYHFAEVPVNQLTLNSLDRLSRSPQYKICAIRVEVQKPEDRRHHNDLV